MRSAHPSGGRRRKASPRSLAQPESATTTRTKSEAGAGYTRPLNAAVAQLVEHHSRKVGVDGSSPSCGSRWGCGHVAANRLSLPAARPASRERSGSRRFCCRGRRVGRFAAWRSGMSQSGGRFWPRYRSSTALVGGALWHRYGFGPSREYEVLHNGQRYDSKAVLGAAHGHQHGDPGPLRSDDFSGGAPTIRKLEELGFNVVPVEGGGGATELGVG